MDTLSKSTSLSAGAIVVGLALLTAVGIEFSRYHTADESPAAETSAFSVENWFSERSLSFLSASRSTWRGIDTESLDASGFFALGPLSGGAQVQFFLPEPEPELEPEIEAEPEEEPLPPPPTSRKAKVVYHGLYAPSRGGIYAYLSIDGTTRVLRPEQAVAVNWNLAEVASDAVVLKNKSGKKVRILFNQEKNLEVPVDASP